MFSDVLASHLRTILKLKTKFFTLAKVFRFIVKTMNKYAKKKGDKSYCKNTEQKYEKKKVTVNANHNSNKR